MKGTMDRLQNLLFILFGSFALRSFALHGIVSFIIVSLIGIASFIGINTDAVQAQTVTRLTYYTGSDLAPAWDPRGITIAYIRSKSGNSSIFDAYTVQSSGQGGEQVLLSGLTADFGVAVGLSWIGTTGFLAVEEAISGFEVLRFDTSLAPFNRTVTNGADAASTVLLSIDGGGGGGLTRISRDGQVALVRFSSAGGAGQISIRAGAVATLTGQASSTFGTVLISANAGTDSRFSNGGSLSPDGSQYVISFPLGSSTTAHDLVVGRTDLSTPRVNITNNASAGIFNITPDFSPDGTKIAFARRDSTTSDTYDLYTINVDGTGLTQLTNTPNFSETNPSWSPDGTSLAFVGTHTRGHENEFPALEPNESFNANIYLLTLAGEQTVTPRTKLSDPPVVTVNENNVTFTFAAFRNAAQKPPKSGQQAALINGDQHQFELLRQSAKAKRVKLSFRYNLEIRKNGAPRRAVISRVSKKNSITVRKLSPGTYTAKYRVEILRRSGGSKPSVSGRTRFSPAATFVVGG